MSEWQLVRVVPTDEMIQAMRNADDYYKAWKHALELSPMPASRGTDDELVTLLTDAQMDVERMAEALRHINELVSNPALWKDPDFVSFYRGFISGACAKGLGVDKDEAPKEDE